MVLCRASHLLSPATFERRTAPRLADANAEVLRSASILQKIGALSVSFSKGISLAVVLAKLYLVKAGPAPFSSSSQPCACTLGERRFGSKCTHERNCLSVRTAWLALNMPCARSGVLLRLRLHLSSALSNHVIRCRFAPCLYLHVGSSTRCG